MRQEDQLKGKYGTDTGFSVPEGYFDELRVQVMQKLPPYPDSPKYVELSLWQRLKPYVYLAAMFAGIWLMMNVFHHVSGYGALSLENPPEAIASALASDAGDFPLGISAGYDYELENEICSDFNDIKEFQSAFGYDLKPEYASMNVSGTRTAQLTNI